ncbi:MAG: acyltransferase family protein [Deltaproteobacteria bacterium]
MSAGTVEGQAQSLDGPALERSFARQHYIDWLRVLAVLLLFPFHTLRVYNAGEAFYVKGSHPSVAVNAVTEFISLWHMPLLFLLAGASTYFALGRRSSRQYLWERVMRLAVPFVFGVFLLVPPQTWYGARFNSGSQQSYWSYLTSGDFLIMNPAGDYYGGWGTGHLWFIEVLFIISLVVLPLLVWGRSERGGAVVRTISRRLARPAWWLLVPFVMAAGFVLPDPLTDHTTAFYLVFFVLGYLTVSDAQFIKSAVRYRWHALTIGIPLALVYVAKADVIDSDTADIREVVPVMYAAGLGGWLIIVGLLGCGKRYLDRASPALAYLAEGSYPVYVLHQTVIVVFAFYLVGWAVWQPLQWLALLALSVLGTFALYEGVRRWSVTRFLFGMRRMQRRPAEAGKAGRAAAGSEKTTATAL